MKLVNVPMADEERIAAYLDGTLSHEDLDVFRNEIGNNEMLESFVSEIKNDEFDEDVSFEQYEHDFDPISAVGYLFDTIDDLYINNKDGIEEPMTSLGMYIGLTKEEKIEEKYDFMIEDLDISNHSAVAEAQKQYGLEPLNIEFDPNTYQWEEDTCAVRSQEIVLRSFGVYVSQDELVQEAAAHGWYKEGMGTPMEAVGNLLDLFNVPNHRLAAANVFNLADELGQGHKVIVGVDVDELYGNSFWQAIKEHLVGKTPNHAMIVSGLDTSDPENTKVVLTDPGTGKTLFEVPYEKFLSAWNDSNCFMVATDDPAPLQYNSDTMINFDYSKGHVAFLGKIPFGEFHEHIVPEFDSYIDSVDNYIEALEQTIANDFNFDDFNRMTERTEIAHEKAMNLQRYNAEQRLQQEMVASNNHSPNNENPYSDEFDEEDEDGDNCMDNDTDDLTN